MPRLTLAALTDIYLAAQSQPYDHEKGGEQAGTKRTAHVDRFSRDRVLKHLDGKMLAEDMTREEIVALAEAIEREPEAPSAQTRRKHLSFLRSVYSWAEERGRGHPFDRKMGGNQERSVDAIIRPLGIRAIGVCPTAQPLGLSRG